MVMTFLFYLFKFFLVQLDHTVLEDWSATVVHVTPVVTSNIETEDTDRNFVGRQILVVVKRSDVAENIGLGSINSKLQCQHVFDSLKVVCTLIFDKVSKEWLNAIETSPAKGLGSDLGTYVDGLVFAGVYVFGEKSFEDVNYIKTKTMLANLGLQKYEKNFKRGLLTDNTMPWLNEFSLRDASIPPGPRLIILDHIQRNPEFKEGQAGKKKR